MINVNEFIYQYLDTRDTGVNDYELIVVSPDPRDRKIIRWVNIFDNSKYNNYYYESRKVKNINIMDCLSGDDIKLYY